MDEVLIDIFKIAGSRRKLAEKLGIAHQAVTKWRKVPSTRVIEVENLTGISRHKQRPDVFGPEPEKTTT